MTDPFDTVPKFPPRPHGMTWTEYALLYGWVKSGN